MKKFFCSEIWNKMQFWFLQSRKKTFARPKISFEDADRQFVIWYHFGILHGKLWTNSEQNLNKIWTKSSVYFVCFAYFASLRAPDRSADIFIAWKYKPDFLHIAENKNQFTFSYIFIHFHTFSIFAYFQNLSRNDSSFIYSSLTCR